MNGTCGVVKTILAWGGVCEYAGGPGHILVPVADSTMVGGTYLAGVFTAKAEG